MGIPLTNVVRSERAAAEIAESARGPVILDGPDLAEHGLALTDGAPPTLAYKRWFGVEPICRVLMEHGTRIAPSTSYAPSRGRGQPGRCLKGNCWLSSNGSGRRASAVMGWLRCGMRCVVKATRSAATG